MRIHWRRRWQDHHHHDREHRERKKQVSKRLLELLVAVTTIQERKKKIADRGHELERTRTELCEIRTTTTTSHNGHKRLKSGLEGM
jgi:uncharacterized protein (DUF342 family)